MKSKIILGLASLLLVLPLTSSAFSIDDAMLSYVNFLKNKIAILESENLQLQEQCSINNIEPKIMNTEILGEAPEVKKTSVAFTNKTKEERNFVDVNLSGDFETAYLVVNAPDGYELATLHFTSDQSFELGPLNDAGKYTYTLEYTENGEEKIIGGSFNIK